MEALFRLLPGPQPILIRYVTTAIFVLMGYGARVGLGELTGPYGFLLFILPVTASALLFDRGTGFFAVALSSILVASLLPWHSDQARHLAAIISFVVVGGCLVFIAEGLHRALEVAHAAQAAADLLLQEMSHRVKNKFAMVSSIISLQARRSSPEVRAALEDVASRVDIIATVHNYLQLSRREGLIDMSEYLPELCRALRGALAGPGYISLTGTSVTVKLAPEKALAAGVIVNELVTNAFKYAFDEHRDGHVRVELTQASGGLMLCVSDDGKGCPADMKAGLGTRLVTVFATQLGGDAVWDSPSDGGCVVRIEFPA